MRSLHCFFMLLGLVPACDVTDHSNDFDRLNTTSLTLSVTEDGMPADTAVISLYFRVGFSYKGQYFSCHPYAGTITLPVFDTIPDFSIV